MANLPEPKEEDIPWLRFENLLPYLKSLIPHGGMTIRFVACTTHPPIHQSTFPPPTCMNDPPTHRPMNQPFIHPPV